MKLLIALVRSMRPQQWTKNVLVFAALIFARKVADPGALTTVVEAFALFCLVASAVYLINDVVDCEEDRKHPDKCKRPIAAGELPVPVALAAAAVCALLGLGASYRISLGLGSTAAAYFGLTIMYQFVFKYRVIFDVFAIAGGFVLRAVAGAEALQVEISPWLLICTLLLALFLALSKRRGEIVLLEETAAEHRSTLGRYSVNVLDQMIAVVTASTLMSYSLYTISDRTVQELGSTRLMYTIPFVIYGIFRYLYLVHQHGEGGHPDRTLLTDVPLLVNVALYALTAGIIIYLLPGGG